MCVCENTDPKKFQMKSLVISVFHQDYITVFIKCYYFYMHRRFVDIITELCIAVILWHAVA